MKWFCLSELCRALGIGDPLRSVGGDPAGSPLYNRLGKAISDALLNGFRQRPTDFREPFLGCLEIRFQR